eukprot:UN23611
MGKPKISNCLRKTFHQNMNTRSIQKSYTHEFRFKSSQIFFEESLICFTKILKCAGGILIFFNYWIPYFLLVKSRFDRKFFEITFFENDKIIFSILL